MTDAAIISAGFQSLKAAFDIGKALLNLGISAEVRTRISEMNDKILTAQESAIAARDYQSALLKQIGELEERIADLEAWEAEKQRYELKNLRNPRATQTFGEVFAYCLKSDASSGEPPHCLCANCFNDGKKSVLQRSTTDISRIDFVFCQRCGGQLSITGPALLKPVGPRGKR